MNHADTIRRALDADPYQYMRKEALAALDGLVAENQRLRDALEGATAFSDAKALRFAHAALDETPTETTVPPLPPPSKTHMVRSGLAQTAKPVPVESLLDEDDLAVIREETHND